MPKHLHRFYGAGDLHFITFSCYQRQPLLASEVRRGLLLEILERVRRRYRMVVLGYVIMPEHVHLLVSEPQRKNLSVVIQALKLGFVRSLDGSPPKRFWQARFYDFNVWTENKRVEKLRYMHRNPVKRGLVEFPEQWHWSSYRFYRDGETRQVRINNTDVMVMRIRTRAA